jgi:hypothetical protein
MYRFYLKTHIKIFINFRIGKSTSVLSTLQIAASGPPLSNPSCREEEGCVDRVTELLSAGQQINLRFRAVTF